MPPFLNLSLLNRNPPPPLACNSAFVHPDFFPPHLHPPQLLAPRTASPLPEREPPPAGRVGRPRLPPPPLRRPPPHGGRGSAPAGSLPLHPLLTAQHRGRLRRPLPLAPRPLRAPGRRRAAPGGALRSPTPLRAGGGPGPGALAYSAGPGRGSRPGQGLYPRAVTRAGLSAGRGAGLSLGRGRGGEEGLG